MEKPFFSIVIPVYNRQDLILKSIQSVVNQTYTNWELIVIDDGSTDKTADVVKQISDHRIFYYYQTNQERSRARNNGIKKATADFVCFLDSDDYYLENHLEELHKHIVENNQSVGLYATGAYVDRGKDRIKLNLYDAKIEHPVRYIFFKKLDMNTVCVHKKILEQFNFDPEISIGEDTHLWLRIALNYPFYQVKKYTTVTVNHDESGMVKYYREADMVLLKKYVNGALKLFSSIDLSQHITRAEKNYYISKKYRSMARSCIWVRKISSVFICVFKALYWTPGFLFTREFWNIIKETAAMVVRIILRRQNPVIKG